MGTYFALMDEAAKRAEEYQAVDRIREFVLALQKDGPKPSKEDLEFASKYLQEWLNNFSKLDLSKPEAAQALERLEGLKSALEAALNAAHS